MVTNRPVVAISEKPASDLMDDYRLGYKIPE